MSNIENIREKSSINFVVLTLFPEMIMSGLNHSMIKRAVEQNIINLNCINIRDFSGNKHNRVDDYPYGGGSGMLLRAEPVYNAYMSIDENIRKDAQVIYMSPQGARLTQEKSISLSKKSNIILLCGHYEGIDQRVIDEIVTEEISVGDYILTGGELPAMIVIDSVSRLIPGVLGKENSFIDESFTDNTLEYPQYTRPSEFLGKKVPDVLLSGHHVNIEKWKEEKSLEITKLKRPDLLK